MNTAKLLKQAFYNKRCTNYYSFMEFDHSSYLWINFL